MAHIDRRGLFKYEVGVNLLYPKIGEIDPVDQSSRNCV